MSCIDYDKPFFNVIWTVVWNYYKLKCVSFSGLQADGQNIVFTDGEYINQIAACKDVSGFILWQCHTFPKPSERSMDAS